jgi:hypothetical protein
LQWISGEEYRGESSKVIRVYKYLTTLLSQAYDLLLLTPPLQKTFDRLLSPLARFSSSKRRKRKNFFFLATFSDQDRRFWKGDFFLQFVSVPFQNIDVPFLAGRKTGLTYLEGEKIELLRSVQNWLLSSSSVVTPPGLVGLD